MKTHLTSAVNQEIVLLKSQIKQLTEKCTRLEQEKLLATIEKGAGFHAVTQQIQQIQEEWI